MKTAKKNNLLLPMLAFCSFLVGFDAIATVPLLPAISASTDMPSRLPSWATCPTAGAGKAFS